MRRACRWSNFGTGGFNILGPEPALPLNLAQMPKSGSPDFEMTPDHPSTPSWKALFRVPGFTYFFVAMLVSLFGTGMNFAGVTWYVLGGTHSAVKVSLIVILVTLPGLVVPPFGGVLIEIGRASCRERV